VKPLMGLHYKGPRVFITFSQYQPSLIFAGKAWGLPHMKPLMGLHCKVVRVYLTFGHFHTSLIFACKAGAYPSKAPYGITKRVL
jgi:hypothetical protein